LRICIKYCGGCRPGYDRVEAVADLQRRLGDRAQWMCGECDDAGLVLVVTGCKTACADITGFRGKMIRYITCEDDIQAFIDEVEER